MPKTLPADTDAETLMQTTAPLAEPDPEPKPKARAKSQPKAKKSAAKADVLFISSTIEAHAYNVMGIQPRWDGARERLIWSVPADRAERFRKHHHVVTGRVVEVAAAE